MPTPEHDARRRHLYLDWILLGAVATAIFVLTPFSVFDDAYISIRHADNLARRGELVFNPGERVEGMSNLLWTLAIAAMIRLSLPPELFVTLFSIALVTWTCSRLVLLGRSVGAPWFAGLLAALFLLLSPDFVQTAVNGLEGALYTALLMEAIYQYRRQQISLTYALLGLTFMTRAEAFVFGPLLTGILVYERRSLRAQRLGLLLFGIITVGVTVWRMFYYGSPLPNSVIAKSHSLDFWTSPLGRYAVKSALLYGVSFITANWHFPIVTVLAALWFLRGRRRAETSSLMGIIAFCVGGILFSYVVVLNNGGDWMPYSRLFMLYGVLYATLFLVLMAGRHIPRLASFPMLIYALVQTSLAVFDGRPGGRLPAIDTEPDPYYVMVTERLGRISTPSDTISAEQLGYISYHLRDHYLHDPTGLTDPYIARHGRTTLTFGKTDMAHTLGVVRPAVLVWNYEAQLAGVEQRLLDQYLALCESDCRSPQANVVLIRKDRAAAIAPAFQDWQAVRITKQGIEPW